MNLKPILLLVLVAIFQFATAQTVSFTNQSSMLGPIPGTTYSDCAVDMNDDNLDDVVRVTSSGVYIDFQLDDGTFSQQFFPLTIENLPNWSICAADIDKNGYTDLLFGNGSRVSFCYANDDGTAFTEVPFPEYIFSQRSTFADIDNDGDIDAFVNHDIDQCHPYRNDGAGNMSLDQTLIETMDEGGNYAAIWVDYDNDGDSDLYITKCRGSAPWGSPKRINQLYQNNGDGTYTEVGPEANMDDGNQSWTTVFEDFDNDGDFDAYTVNHYSGDVPAGAANVLMRNNGDGTFTDIIADSGIDALDLGAWNCDAGDFNNDGFIDIFSEMDHALYLNNGDWTFTGQNLNVYAGGIGDFNNDGFLDVISGSSLFINNGNDNNWITVALQGIASNKDGIGARIEIYGEWGIQIREVRSGESFAPMSSLTEHFGLGSATAIDQMIIKWPSGVVTTVDNPSINTQHVVVEAGCVLPATEVVAEGETSICPGETVVLTAESGADSYVWSTGENTQSIEVGNPGSYSCVYFDADGCASVSNNISIQIIEDDSPVITLNGPDVFCQGETVQLESSLASSYAWSNNGIGQIIEAGETGEYYVVVDALCGGGVLTSESIFLTALDAAEVPVAEDVIVDTPQTVTLTATGSNLMWYDSETSADPIGEGESLTVEINNTSTYWVEANTIYGGEQEEGGKTFGGGGGLPATGGQLFFDAYEPFTIQEVTIFVPDNDDSIDLAGERIFQLYNSNNELIAEHVEFFEEGMHVVALNFEVPQGNNLAIGCVQNDLFRNDSGVNYPYSIGAVGEIFDSTFGSTYYYYFYDWKIAKEQMICPSARVPVMAGITAVQNLSADFNVEVYPNPARGEVQVEFSLKDASRVRVSLIDASGRKVLDEDWGTLNGDQLKTLHLEDMAPGIYQLRIRLGNEWAQTTLVVE